MIGINAISVILQFKNNILKALNKYISCEGKYEGKQLNKFTHFETFF